MLRLFTLILFATLSASAQDSAFVAEVCKKFKHFREMENIDSIDSQFSWLTDLTTKYFSNNKTFLENPVQSALRFQYRLHRELSRTCADTLVQDVKLAPHSVIDLEEKLSVKEIDSLSKLSFKIGEEKKVYLYIVTIDDYYPDSNITDFSNRYRDYWATANVPKRGVVLILISIAQRQIRISTSYTSMKYLTDDECSEVIKLIVPHFREGKYFKGLASGLLSIESRL